MRFVSTDEAKGWPWIASSTLAATQLVGRTGCLAEVRHRVRDLLWYRAYDAWRSDNKAACSGTSPPGCFLKALIDLHSASRVSFAASKRTRQAVTEPPQSHPLMSLYYILLWMTRFHSDPRLGLTLLEAGPLLITPVKLIGFITLVVAIFASRHNSAAPRLSNLISWILPVYAVFPIIVTFLSGLPIPSEPLSSLVSLLLMLIATRLLVNAENRVFSTVRIPRAGICLRNRLDISATFYPARGQTTRFGARPKL